MLSAQRKRQVKPRIIEQTLGNEAFRSSLERCLVAASDSVFQPTNPYYIPNFVGQNMYFNTAHFGSQELRDRGFRLIQERNQLRLFTETAFVCPVTITFWSGVVSADGIARCKWPRGMATRELVDMNKFSYQPVQPSLFSQGLNNWSAPSELYLGVVHNTSYNYLEAWVVVAVDLLSDTAVQCAEWAQICRRTFDRQAIIGDLMPPEVDSDYDVDIEDNVA